MLFLTEVSRGNPNLFFIIFFIPDLLNLLPRGVKPRPAGCYLGALTTRLKALSHMILMLRHITFEQIAYMS
jgi:hypothetical protein